MNINRWSMGRGAMVAAALALVTGYASAQEEKLSAKGIYIDGRENKPGGKAGVKFDVLLVRGGANEAVPSNHEFHNGDRMKFRMELNRDLYVYILNRTFNGDPETYASKGIERIRDEDRQTPPAGPTYKLLFPVGNESNLIRAGHAVTVPGTADFRMDNRPGVEKLYVVVSDKKLNITQYFNTKTGDINSGGSAGGNHNDTNDDVLNQLNAQLSTYAANSITELAPKGIVRESDSYGIVRDGEKPAQFEVNLRHLPR